MCTVLLRFDPAAAWPVLLGAVRDEFADRPWDHPGAHWSGARLRRIVGGRDRTAGGTWLAVDPEQRAVAAVLNGVRLAPPPAGPRPSRGWLPLRVLAEDLRLGPAGAAGYDGFHLLRATTGTAEVWSWDGETLSYRVLDPGDHILVNHGVDAVTDPLVPHFLPLLAGCGSPRPEPGMPTAAAWGGWVDLLAGDGIAPSDPRALLVRVKVGERTFASTSASLVALGPGTIRYDFSADPWRPGSWSEIRLG